MTKAELVEKIFQKKSFLCVGLDTDITKIPTHLLSEKDPVFAFNKSIIDATHDLCIAYKLNTAFYESRGVKGWESLQKTIQYLPENTFSIADAKRGDIGNTSHQYAKAFFEDINVDAITLSPYMGEDSISPFLQYSGKWAIILAHTSNAGAADFQELEVNNEKLYEIVLKKSKQWGSAENMMYVLGANHIETLKPIREIIPEHFLLVPGVGAQGGALKEVALQGMNKTCGLLVNASRSIIYAGKQKDFYTKAREAALALQQQMKTYL